MGRPAAAWPTEGDYSAPLDWWTGTAKTRHKGWACLQLSFSQKTFGKGEQDTAELGANTDANQSCTQLVQTKFWHFFFLFDANKRIGFYF